MEFEGRTGNPRAHPFRKGTVTVSTRGRQRPGARFGDGGAPRPAPLLCPSSPTSPLLWPPAPSLPSLSLFSEPPEVSTCSFDAVAWLVEIITALAQWPEERLGCGGAAGAGGEQRRGGKEGFLLNADVFKSL